jgi:Flp pilus assembly protein TadD
MISAAAALSLMLATGSIRPPTSADELRFGLEAAQHGLWTEARFRFERAVALDPNNAKAHNDLAVALEQQGEFQKARDAYEQALKLKPGDDQIQQNYDLFREADDKRNRKAKAKATAGAGTSTATPAITPAPTPTPAVP